MRNNSYSLKDGGPSVSELYTEQATKAQSTLLGFDVGLAYKNAVAVQNEDTVSLALPCRLATFSLVCSL